MRPLKFLERDIAVERRGDGTLIVRNNVPLGALAPHIPFFLRRNAVDSPGRCWLARRQPGQPGWLQLAYGEALAQADAVTQALLDLDAAGRAVMVLSGNSIEHGVLQLAAMQARMPYVPVTPAYALLSGDLARLKSIVQLVKPAVVFVQAGPPFERALQVLDLEGVAVVHAGQAPGGVEATPWEAWLQTPPTPRVQASIQAITHATIAKYLFTSGSTGSPKAVTFTQGMLCAGASMHSQLVELAPEERHGAVLDWLPWSHVAGGNAVFNGVLEDAGTLYIDDGKPVPGAFGESIRNLREVSPVRFSSVPSGYAMLADALDRDEVLGASLFRHLRRMVCSGARLPDDTWNRMNAHAVRHTGARIPFVAGYGSTETGASATYVFWLAERSGLIGLPHPGVEMKLVPLEPMAIGARYEVRIRSKAVTPGYLGQPGASAQALDEEGFFRMGDAATFVDPADPREGFAFAGRIAEDFKLLSGAAVRVGALRVAVLAAAGGLLSDAVVTGADRPWVGLLAWLNLDACRVRWNLPQADAAQLMALPALREALVHGIRHAAEAGAGSSMRIQRVRLLEELPSLDAGEITDKGYINQRLVLERRAADVAALYAEPALPDVLCVDEVRR